MIRKAKVQDEPEIVNLVNHYAGLGKMLLHSKTQVYNGLRDYSVIEMNDRIIGCGALVVIWSDIAEIRSVTMAPEYTSQGWGRVLVNKLLKDARELE